MIRTTLLLATLAALPTDALDPNPLESKYGRLPKGVAVEPKPATTRPAEAPPGPVLADPVRRALTYLGGAQHETGGWGHFVVKPLNRPRTGPRPANALPLITKDLHFPPNLAETAAVAAAFLEAGVSPTTGEGAAPLQKALHALRALSAPPVADRDRGIVERCAVTRAMLKPDVDAALALDAVLAYRARLAAGHPAREAADNLAGLLVARLHGAQEDGGAWPPDFKADGILQVNARRAPQYAKGTAARAYFDAFPRPAPALADACIVRSLFNARRAGVDVPRETLGRAIALLADLHDPATGATGGPETPDNQPRAFHRAAAALNLLHQLARATPPHERADRQRTLDRAHDAFFKKLRDAHTPKPLGPPRNPLDARPKAAKPDRALSIPVPISTVEVLAYFLLIESLQDSAHPDARPVAAGITQALASRQRDDRGWTDPNVDDALTFHWALHGGVDTDNLPPRSTNHLLTALTVRTLLLPHPPELAGPPRAPAAPGAVP
jgi:hypothetical protein